MSKWMLLGLMMLLPWGAAPKADEYNYDPNLCQAFCHNMDPAFSVPAGKQYKLTIDCTHCGGMVQNYCITLMTAKHTTPYATLMVLDQYGKSVGVSDPGHHCVMLGNVAYDAIYTVVVTSGSRKSESCVLCYTGAI